MKAQLSLDQTRHAANDDTNIRSELSNYFNNEKEDSADF
jgi:hypothetical protein